MEVSVAFEFFLGLFYRKEVQTEYLDFNLKCIEMVGTEYSAAVALSLSFLLYFRSSMGVMEPRGVHVYPLCWHTPQPGCPHLQSQICQSGPVDHWADPGIRTQTGPNTHLQHSSTALSVLLLTYSNRDLHNIKMTDSLNVVRGIFQQAAHLVPDLPRSLSGWSSAGYAGTNPIQGGPAP